MVTILMRDLARGLDTFRASSSGDVIRFVGLRCWFFKDIHTLQPIFPPYRISLCYHDVNAATMTPIESKDVLKDQYIVFQEHIYNHVDWVYVAQDDSPETFDHLTKSDQLKKGLEAAMNYKDGVKTAMPFEKALQLFRDVCDVPHDYIVGQEIQQSIQAMNYNATETTQIINTVEFLEETLKNLAKNNGLTEFRLGDKDWVMSMIHTVFELKTAPSLEDLSVAALGPLEFITMFFNLPQGDVITKHFYNSLVGKSVDDLRHMVGMSIFWPLGPELEPIEILGQTVNHPDAFLQMLSKADVTALETLSRVSDRWLNIARHAFWKKILRTNDAGVEDSMDIDVFLKADGPNVAHLGLAVRLLPNVKYMYTKPDPNNDEIEVDVTILRTLSPPSPFNGIRPLFPVRECIPGMLFTGSLLLALYAVNMTLKRPNQDLVVPRAAFYKSTIPHCEVPAGITIIATSAFSDCHHLRSVVLPASLMMISESAFEGCKNLPSIKLPAGLKTIGAFVFADCTSLASVELPAGLTSIAFETFRNCTSLASIKLPASCTTIESGAFRNCTSLRSVTLPADTKVNDDAFHNCPLINLLILTKHIGPQLVTRTHGPPFNTVEVRTELARQRQR